MQNTERALNDPLKNSEIFSKSLVKSWILNFVDWVSKSWFLSLLAEIYSEYIMLLVINCCSQILTPEVQHLSRSQIYHSVPLTELNFSRQSAGLSHRLEKSGYIVIFALDW